MSRKSLYWIIALLVTLVIAALLWAFAASPDQPPDNAADSSESGAMDHSQMDHGEMGHEQMDTSTDVNLRGYLTEQDTIMTSMMDDMNSVKPSGNAAASFLAGMVPHHASAISMAESYLNHGGAHETLAPLAREIITAQTTEIEQMESMLDTLTATGNRDETRETAYWEAYDAMMGTHSMSHTAAESLDAAFAEGMLMHHQMAVDMSKAILPHTDEANVKRLAQNIIDSQEKEISEMQSVLDALAAA